MHKATPCIADPPVKVYKQVPSPGGQLRRAADMDLVKFRVFLRDRPGSLAAFSSLIADCRGNSSFFHYDRAVDISRVAVEVMMNSQTDLNPLLLTLQAKKNIFEEIGGLKEDIQITALESVLRQGRSALIFPGHGEYYPLEQAE